MNSLRSCTVTIHDLNDVAHTVDVSASTLYEAVGHALAALRQNDWVGELGKGFTTVAVKIRPPEVTHTIKIKDFESWLSRQGKTPGEIILKTRVRQLLGMPERKN